MLSSIQFIFYYRLNHSLINKISRMHFEKQEIAEDAIMAAVEFIPRHLFASSIRFDILRVCENRFEWSFRIKPNPTKFGDIGLDIGFDWCSDQQFKSPKNPIKKMWKSIKTCGSILNIFMWLIILRLLSAGMVRCRQKKPISSSAKYNADRQFASFLFLFMW